MKIQYEYIITSTSNDNKKVFQVVETKDGFVFSEGRTVKGAVIGALVCGVRLNKIDFNGHWVPVNECLEVVR